MKEDDTKILIVDNDRQICSILSRLMKKQGCLPLVAYEGKTALKMILSESPDVLLLDNMMPEMTGMELLKRVRQLDPDLPIIMITAYADICGAVNATKAGAFNYLSKPFDHDELIELVHRATTERKQKLRLRHHSIECENILSLRKMMGTSDSVARFVSDVLRVSKSDLSVIIVGETGTGKELIAQAIHNESNRSEKPFLPFDCGAIPEALLESELFGHEKGSFTGAVSQKIGLFEAVKGGPLFMDEISNMPFSSQAKLLRVLQEKKAYRVGSVKPFKVHARIIVATNRELDEVSSDEFRKDLFYRLNEFTIRIPPLRKRKGDIPYLAKRFLAEANIKQGKNVHDFLKSAMDAMVEYDWPGNVRQLKSAIRRAVLLADDIIIVKHLDFNNDIDFRMKSIPYEQLTKHALFDQFAPMGFRNSSNKILPGVIGSRFNLTR